MKFLVTGLLACFMLLGMSSCKKDFTCECTFTDSTKNFTTTISNVYRNEAKVVCTDYDQFVGNCALK